MQRYEKCDRLSDRKDIKKLQEEIRECGKSNFQKLMVDKFHESHDFSDFYYRSEMLKVAQEKPHFINKGRQ